MADSQNTEGTTGRQPAESSGVLSGLNKPFEPKPGTATYTREPCEKTDRLEMDPQLMEDYKKGNVAWCVIRNLRYCLQALDLLLCNIYFSV